MGHRAVILEERSDEESQGEVCRFIKYPPPMNRGGIGFAFSNALFSRESPILIHRDHEG